jgi:hypothetical protein
VSTRHGALGQRTAGAPQPGGMVRTKTELSRLHQRVDSFHTASYRGYSPRQRHTRRKPGPQSHGSSLSSATVPPDATKDPKIAELPKFGRLRCSRVGSNAPKCSTSVRFTRG